VLMQLEATVVCEHEVECMLLFNTTWTENLRLCSSAEEGTVPDMTLDFEWKCSYGVVLIKKV